MTEHYISWNRNAYGVPDIGRFRLVVEPTHILTIPNSINVCHSTYKCKAKCALRAVVGFTGYQQPLRHDVIDVGFFVIYAEMKEAKLIYRKQQK